ncbi:hypothetical protein FRC04_011603 [Tulasnella sp. 424]|nr:hypothetical protein FRC04_011603 [Tulasnella sp. 424]
MDDRYVSFRGQDGNEAEEFIQAVRRAAFDADKDCDDRWMARFASTCMSGKALRWYESLDDDVQESWKRLRKAILVRYPPADVGSEDAIVPSASAAPAAAAVPAAPASAPPTAAPWPSSFPQVDFAPPAAASPPSHAPKFASAPAPPAAEQWPSSFPQVDFASPAPIRPQNYTPKRAPAVVPLAAAQWPSSFPYVDFAPPAAIPPQSYGPKSAPAAAPPAAAQWPSSFPLVDFDPFAPAPSGSHTSKPSDKPFDGASGIIEIRYAETNRLMGYLSQKLRSNGAAQHKFIGMTWLHSDSARAPAGNL